jgi:hypothetical protein
MMPKNDVLMSIFTFFSENLSRHDPANLPVSDRLTVITDHPSPGEVLPGRGLQCGVVSGNIPINFSSRPHRVRGETGSHSGLALSK